VVFSTSSGTKIGRLLPLLPKKVDAVEVKGFHTISLIHSFAKSELSNQLVPKLSTLVSVNQIAFVRGRCTQR
jgi:hypothetical protein